MCGGVEPIGDDSTYTHTHTLRGAETDPGKTAAPPRPLGPTEHSPAQETERSVAEDTREREREKGFMVEAVTLGGGTKEETVNKRKEGKEKWAGQHVARLEGDGGRGNWDSNTGACWREWARLLFIVICLWYYVGACSANVVMTDGLSNIGSTICMLCFDCLWQDKVLALCYVGCLFKGTAFEPFNHSNA